MWTCGRGNIRLSKKDKEEIRYRVLSGEPVAEVAQDFHISEFEVLKVAGMLKA